MAQKKNSGRKPDKRIAKNPNPFIVAGALTIPFELMTTPDGKIITCHVKQCVANGFMHNHDKANDWLRDNAGDAVLYIIEQMIKNAKAATIQQTTNSDGSEVVDQKVVRLPVPENMNGAAEAMQTEDKK